MRRPTYQATNHRRFDDVEYWTRVFDDRARYLELVKRSLKADGRVAVVEWKPGQLSIGPEEEEHKIPREQLVRELDGASFELVSSPDVLPYQCLLVFGSRRR